MLKSVFICPTRWFNAYELLYFVRQSRADGALVAQELNHLISAAMEGPPRAVATPRDSPISSTALNIWPVPPPRDSPPSDLGSYQRGSGAVRCAVLATTNLPLLTSLRRPPPPPTFFPTTCPSKNPLMNFRSLGNHTDFVSTGFWPRGLMTW
jgi:hypothetical protein